jgi:hypothetical protein
MSFEHTQAILGITKHGLFTEDALAVIRYAKIHLSDKDRGLPRAAADQGCRVLLTSPMDGSLNVVRFTRPPLAL